MNVRFCPCFVLYFTFRFLTFLSFPPSPCPPMNLFTFLLSCLPIVIGCLTKLSPVTVPSKLNEFCEGSPDGNSPISSSSANSNDGSTSRGTILSTETGSKDSHMLENFVVTPPHISSTTHTSLIGDLSPNMFIFNSYQLSIYVRFLLRI